MRRNLQTLRFYIRPALSILLSAIAGWVAFHNVPKPLPELSRSEFLAEVRQGRVQKVIIEDQEVITGSRYLCIVEGAATRAVPRSLPLPFEGDHKLSLILSKALLLADDRKLEDESILRQLPPLPA